MITVDIKPAPRRFGVPTKRKQWKFEITAGNGEPIDPRDTYANVRDIKDVLQLLRSGEMEIRVHYLDGVQVSTIPATHGLIADE